MLELMNKSVHRMGGQILMTFFVAVIDPQNKKIIYANASHNPPFFLRAKGEEYAPTKSDIIPSDGKPWLSSLAMNLILHENHEIDIESGDVISFLLMELSKE